MKDIKIFLTKKNKKIISIVVKAIKVFLKINKGYQDAEELLYNT